MTGAVLTAILFLAPLAARAAEPPTVKELAPLVRAEALKRQPRLDEKTEFRIRPFEVKGLWEEMGIVAFDVQYLSNGSPFNGYVGYFHDGKIDHLAANFGGHGLMSGLVHDKRFVFTFSWGSGMHRSQVRAAVIKDGRLAIIDSGGFVDQDLFVKTGPDGKIEVFSGQFTSFNQWTKERSLGVLEIPPSQAPRIVGSSGAVLKPTFPPRAQEPAKGR